ncbi:MAG: TonB-dependent receptor, partial [Gammaproteobacteria bacterium]|nr:TonB-dependent receptor [Gammaproteobacteria bacterium]
MNAPLLNVASRTVSGLDLAVSYSFELPTFLSLPGKDGRLGLRWISTWQFEDETQQLADQPAVDCAGFYSGTCSADGNRITPDFRGLFRADWKQRSDAGAAEVQIIGDL